jgi:hypothetical protein
MKLYKYRILELIGGKGDWLLLFFGLRVLGQGG